MRTDHYRGVTRHCVMCGDHIPPERKWDAVTCSPGCSKARKQYGRSRRDQQFCRYCLHPSTPEDRAIYAMWRKWEKKGMADEATAAQILETKRIVRENERLKRRLAELEPVEAQPEEAEPVGNEVEEENGQDNPATR